jgi:hypothetical protein
MKTMSGIKVVNELMGQQVDLSDRCCGESGTLAVARPDISTQVRFAQAGGDREGRGQAARRRFHRRREDADLLPVVPAGSVALPTMPT